MEYIILAIVLVLSMLLLKLVFKINIKELKKIQENEEISLITNQFPENLNVAREYLEMLDNKDVQVEEAHDSKTSLYIVTTDKIIIADVKNNYARLQVIAHECIHSIQDRALLLFNFIFSNILIISFLVSIILTILKIFDNISLVLFILAFMSLIQFSVRSLLEIDAMIRSKFLSKEYIEKKKLITKEEENRLLDEYEKINRAGIPVVVYNLLAMDITWLVIYLIVAGIVY